MERFATKLLCLYEVGPRNADWPKELRNKSEFYGKIKRLVQKDLQLRTGTRKQKYTK